MTRKHFQAIAGVLRRVHDSSLTPDAKLAVHAVALGIANVLATTNERFDRAKFLNASIPGDD